MNESTEREKLDDAASLLARYIQLRLGPMREPEQVFRALLAHHFINRDNNAKGRTHDQYTNV